MRKHLVLTFAPRGNFNPALKAKYDQFIQAGKPAKVALTAIMRKLIVMANALLRRAQVGKN